MSFDIDPAEDKPTYPCPKCSGEIYQNPYGIWECDDCDWTPQSLCDACGKPGKIQYDSQGEGRYCLCERTDGDHDESHYCGVEMARAREVRDE